MPPSLLLFATFLGASPVETASPLDIFVLDLAARDVSPRLAEEVTDLVALEVSKFDDVTVTTRDDLKASIEPPRKATSWRAAHKRSAAMRRVS